MNKFVIPWVHIFLTADSLDEKVRASSNVYLEYQKWKSLNKLSPICQFIKKVINKNTQSSFLFGILCVYWLQMALNKNANVSLMQGLGL